LYLNFSAIPETYPGIKNDDGSNLTETFVPVSAYVYKSYVNASSNEFINFAKIKIDPMQNGKIYVLRFF